MAKVIDASYALKLKEMNEDVAKLVSLLMGDSDGN